MLNERSVSLWNALFAVVMCIFAAFIILEFGFVQNVFSVDVSGESMEATLQNGDSLYADKTAVPQRGDIVIIDVSAYREKFSLGGDNIIKRLIGLEGDTVRIEDGKVYRRLAGEEQFELLNEDYAQGRTLARKAFEVTVGEGEIFFLGDNREHSTDSRAIGCLKLSDIEGVVADWSVEDKSATRWDAFFTWVKGLI